MGVAHPRRATRSWLRLPRRTARLRSALRGLDGPHLCQLVHCVCQLTLVLFQLMLGMCP